MDKSVKGFFFVDYVRMIRSKKDADWSKHLTSEDMRFLEERILDSEWYPFDTFERMGIGILEEIAGNDMDMVRLWGRTYMDNLFGIHTSLVTEGDPRESLVRFQVLRNSFFNFDPVNTLVFFRNYAKLQIAFDMSPKAEEAATWQTVGYFERLLELSGASNISFNFTEKAWEGDPATILELDWSEVPHGSRVKGVLFVDYVRMIKRKKDADWSAFLTPKDMGLLSQKIEPEEWYPFDTFERMGIAILHEIAAGDMQLVRTWGKLQVDPLVKIYDSLVEPGEPRESMMRYQVLRRSFFDFDSVEMKSLLGDFVRLEIDYFMSRTAEQAAAWQTLGFFERLIELSGAKNIKHKFIARAWEGDPTTILEIKWE